MTAPSDIEQLLLELVNRAREDPEGEVEALLADPAAGLGAQPNITEALDAFAVDLARFAAQMEGYDPAPPLAWSGALSASAETHSARMITFDEQAHEFPGEPGLVDRILAEGYARPTILAENVFGFTQDAVHAHGAFVIDWGEGPGGIQDPAGHRETILNPALSEVGIGILEAPNPESALGPFVTTQHFGARADAPAALTGVLTSDADGDAFYDIGEGLGGVTVTAEGAAGTFTATSHASGGYTLPLPAGAYTVVFEGGALEGTVARSVEIADDNVKLDIAYLDAVHEGAILGTRGADAALKGTAGADDIRALEGDDLVLASAGADRLSGGRGEDTVAYGAARDAYDIALAADGSVTVTDATGATDRLTGVERIDLLDGNLLFDIGGEELGFAYRTYTAALGRLPGEEGLRFWTETLEDGGTRKAVAQSFADSPEFAARYGDDISDAAYVTALYENVHGRAPDPDGFEFWLGAMESGAKDRAEVLIGFAESPENVARMEDNLSDGVFVLNGADDFLFA